MEIYLTEEEQLDAIKRWWKKYGQLTVLVLVLCAAGFSAWRYWQIRTHRHTQQASLVYEQILTGFTQHENTLTQHLVTQLQSDVRRKVDLRSVP